MPRTVNEGFDAFLKKISSLSNEHKQAASHRNSVKRCLKNSFDYCELFETGSFGNGTSVRHHSDTDYFAVLKAEYVRKSSATVLRDLREALEYTFPRTRNIRVKCPAVSVPFGQYESETLEITPCVFHGMIRGHRAFRIPDGDGGWLRSSPDAHNRYVREQDNKMDGQLKLLIRLLKAWKFYQNVPVRSFYLELFATRHLASRRRLDLPLDLYKLFIALYKHELDEFDDPMGVTLGLTACNTTPQRETTLSRLATATARATKAIEAQQRGKYDLAFDYWNKLFNYKFPAYR
jgi:hypothetical protein